MPDPCRGSRGLHPSPMSLDRTPHLPLGSLHLEDCRSLLPSCPKATITTSLEFSPALPGSGNDSVALAQQSLRRVTRESVPRRAFHWTVTIMTDGHC